ncbi:helix-turn-helix domain-containing protein [Gluconacetobacter azotocaptans]|uniref:IclR family transcriptional regulator n=1 Tax=Gluconacetobacter azotocaptans TaxID=142834 RepID=UPI0019566E6B|nr:helix-turn-helix domain-containing protein [Gluconacetobacter azotocaptans]MBM9400766.1 helix-turn-helix domain-containing protein [Gluconacetobacter azotocaptans]
MGQTSGSQHSQNSERAALILISLGQATWRGLSLKEIAERVGAEKPATHRTLLALKRHGMVVQNELRGRYRLGPAALALGQRRTTPIERIEQWKPAIAELAKTYQASAFLLERSGLDAIITDMYMTDPSLKVLGGGGIGGRLPLGYGLGSTAILAEQDEDDQCAILQANLERYTTLDVDVGALRAYLPTVRMLGYDYRRDTFIEGISGISVPLHEDNGRCRAALTIAKPSEFLPDSEVPALIAHMKTLTDGSYRPPGP